MELDFAIKYPCGLILCGPTMSGKTYLALDIIKNRNIIFNEKIDKVIYIYSEFQEIFLKVNDPQVIFTNEVNNLENLIEGKTLILIDDMLLELSSSHNKFITEFFIKKIHHRNVSMIIMLQNLYAKNLRTVSLNAQYLAFFRQVRDLSSISRLAAQISPRNINWVVEAYEIATSKPNGYLFMDLHPSSSNRFRLRSSILPTPDTLVFSNG